MPERLTSQQLTVYPDEGRVNREQPACRQGKFTANATGPDQTFLSITPTDNFPCNTPEEFKGIMSYNPWYDIQDFLRLKYLNGRIEPEAFVKLQTQTINRKRRDLEKMLGERFAVEKSQITYSIQNGRLTSPDYPCPVIQQYKKGQRTLKDLGSTETEREQAEIEGLEKVEEIFAQGKLKKDERVIVISAQGPEGSLYNENYFDEYKEENGQIIMTRYHSTHSYREFLNAGKKASANFKGPQDEILNAAFFLKQPIVTELTTRQILEVFAQDPDTQAENINREIVKTCLPYINYQIRQLIEAPQDIEEIKKGHNTIYNVADLTDIQIKKRAEQKIFGKNLNEYAQHLEQPFSPNIQIAIEFLGRQSVRPVIRGCPGGQKGFIVSQPLALTTLARSIGAKSALDFSPFANSENEDRSDFQCPGVKTNKVTGGKEKCTYKIRYGAGIKQCPECGLPATCP